jgi:predicted aspartyl protease
MIKLPGLLGFFLLMTVVLWMGFPQVNQAGKGPVYRDPVPMNKVFITGSPLTDPQGNFIGVTIPLKRAGRLLLLEGTVDDVTGNFILDTGSSKLVLNTTYFRNYMITRNNDEGGGVTGSTGTLAQINIRHMQASDLGYANVTADITPLGHLENRRGIKILGLFGMSLLKNLEIVIDSRNNELQLYKLDKNGNRVGMQTKEIKFDITNKIEQYRNIMFVKASIGGNILDFCLDTGAESNVLSIDAPRQALGAVTITRRSNMRGVGSDNGEVLLGVMNDFVLGNRKFSPMETILCSLADLSDKYGYSIDGMLGYDFFTKGKIYINLVKKVMGICLNPEEKP